ncbi:uncharacterized protein LOC144246618 isoform X1 [Lonchura striata]
MFGAVKLSCSHLTLVLTSFQMQTVQISGREPQSWEVQADSSSQGPVCQAVILQDVPGPDVWMSKARCCRCPSCVKEQRRAGELAFWHSDSQVTLMQQHAKCVPFCFSGILQAACGVKLRLQVP